LEINHHITFKLCDEAALVSYLKQNNISYDADEFISSLDIYESNVHWTFIKKYIEERDLFCLSESVFSAEELNQSERLTVRSVWANGYPQPEGEFEYKDITYDGTSCRKCGVGLVQVDSFRIRTQPKWGKRHFMALNWVDDEFFVDEIAKNLIEQKFPYISFIDVKNKKGTESFDGVYQMIIPVLNREGVVKNQESIREILVCEECGAVKFHPNSIGMLKMKRSAFDNAPDIAKTAEFFGWGCGADRNIVVSQKFRKFLIDNHLDRGLEFEPIELV